MERSKAFDRLVPVSWVRSLGANIIDVVVGTEPEERFCVHEGLISSTSLFFRKLIEGGWEGVEERIVRLPDNNADDFKTYLHWMYSGNVPYLSDAAKVTRDRHLVDAFIFGNQLQDNNYKDDIVTTIAHMNNGELFYPETLIYIYSNASRLSKLRLLSVDLFRQCQMSNKDWAAMISDTRVALELGVNNMNYMMEFIDELVIALLDGQGNSQCGLDLLRGHQPRVVPTDNLCKYHSHPVTEACPRLEPSALMSYFAEYSSLCHYLLSARSHPLVID